MKDDIGNWATRDTWTCGENCGCKAQDAITTELTEQGDVE